MSCVEDLRRRYPAGPEGMIDYVGLLTDDEEFNKSGALPYSTVSRRVQQHVAFGPWIAFKVADMLERCLGIPVLFGEADVMYESPTKAALALAKMRMGVNHDGVRFKDEAATVRYVLAHLAGVFGGYDAPPGGGRKVGLQELETILCKWGSHMSGHYPLDNDLVEIRAGAEPWAAVSPAAAEFLHWLPRPGQAEPIAV